MANYYEILDLDPRYHVAARELEERYHAKSKLHHPDRHVKADGTTRVKNALATAELNQAYRTLKDPVKRAEYLLKLHGVDVGGENSRQSHPVDPGFLMEIMELREELAEARGARNEARVDALASDVRARRDRAMDEVEEGFRGLGSPQQDGAGEAARVQAIAGALVALRYYHRFLEEIEVHEEQRATGAA
ncbi:MAG: Fe-S protein assembly co-chaperone HscB [Myxococcales bacterium]|nr:Fe-S protein assembly co-chaperone HscB [Myxococcales bacterium]